MFLGTNTGLKENAKCVAQTDTLFFGRNGISHIVATQEQEGLYRMREPRASYICNFDTNSSALSNYMGLILDESLIKSGGWLGSTPSGY